MDKYKSTKTKPKTLPRILAFLCAVCCIFNLSASADEQITAAGGGAAVTTQSSDKGYSAIVYNADNGLPTSEANTVLSSSDGFIWIGGYSGLVRYDGTSFERQDSSSGITSVNTLFEDSKGRLWIGTNDNGIVCMNKGQSELYSYGSGLDSVSINAVAEDNNGNIIVGTKLGVYYFDANMKIAAIGDSQIKNSYIKQLKADKNGAICGVTKNGALFRIKDLRMTEFYNNGDLGVDELTAVYPSPNQENEVWFGTDSGLVCRGSFADNFAHIEKTKLYYNTDQSDGQALASEPVNSINYASDRIWALMNSRIFFTDENGKFTQIEDLPLDGGIENMTEDFEGNLWFTSRRQGVMKIAANKFLDLSDHAGLEPRIVNSTYVHDGMIYIGTDTGLQITTSDLVPVTNELTEFLGDTRIRCISEDLDKNLWISTYNNDLGLVCYTAAKKIVNYTEADGLPSNKVRCTSIAPDGSVLAATNGGLAVIRSGRIERTLDRDKGLNNTVILTVEATDDGKYYLGSDGDGIYVADGNKLTHISCSDGLTSDVVLRIKKDKERNVIWIVTSNSIEYIKDGVIKNVSTFPYTNNYDIYFDNSGNAWILASNGIYVANARDMTEKEDFDYVFYNVSNGLASVPTSNSFSYLGDNGDLYISGRNGVSRVNIDSYFVQNHDIKFSVPYIEDEEQRYYPNDNNTFILPSSANNITIYGYALTYMMHDPRIQYYLKGADNKPTIVKKSVMTPVRYTNLKGGKYEYQLSLIDSSSNEIKQTVTFRIIKQHKFYEQWWFYIVCAAIAAVVIGALIRLYLHFKTAAFRKREEEQKRLFEQTATALVTAIDAKDRYTHGHSTRVAKYSRKIAELSGKSQKECDDIYYAALLHDVGKIGVPESIINKDGKLTDEEYSIIKQHPEKGLQILKNITDFPYLTIGAHYHHERYDGKGYPENLKGTEISEMARIIAVADAYDAMTSKRSYRDPLPQEKVRSEILRGKGAQFDPKFADIMLKMIDEDKDYLMKDTESIFPDAKDKDRS